MKTTTTLLTAVTMMIAVLISGPSFGKVNPTDKNINLAVSTEDLRGTMQRLWAEHATLTLGAIFCIVDNEPGIEDVKNKMISNQAEIANTIGLYYGSAAGKKINDMLYTNITLAADVMIASKKGHNLSYEKADKKWKESTASIYTFLCQSNSCWNDLDTKAMIFGQVGYITSEIDAVNDKDFDACAKIHNNSLKAVSLMADAISNSIMKQFPDRFPVSFRLVSLK